MKRDAIDHKAFTLPVIALIFLCFIMGTSEFIVIGILSNISGDMHISLSTAGALITIFAFTYAVGTPIVTALTTKLDRYRLLLALVFIFAAGNLASGLSYSYPLLLISRMVTAVVSGVLISLSMTFAHKITPHGQQGKVIAGLFSGFSIASTVGVPLGAAVSHLLGWRSVFLMISVISLFILWMLAKYLPKTRSVQTAGIWRQFVLLKDRRIWLGVLIPFLGSAGVYVFYSYLRPILESEFHIPVASITVVLFVYGFCTIISNLLSGKIAEMGGMKRVPLVFILQVIFLMLLPLVTYSQVLGLSVIFILGVLMYLMNAPNQLHFLSVATSDYPYALNLASSLSSIFFNLGIALGSFTGGLIVDHFDLRYVGWGGAIFACGAFFSVVALNRWQRRGGRKEPASDSLG